MITMTCRKDDCDNKFQRYPSNVRSEDGAYCSIECMHSDSERKINMVGKTRRKSWSSTEQDIEKWRTIINGTGANSISELARMMQMPRHVVSNMVKELDIDVSNMMSAKGRPAKAEDVLCRSDTRRNKTVKKFLLDNHLLEEVCSECGQGTQWNRKTLVLELDHINGDPLDNVLENLRFLCPNCHTQTDTNKGKKNGKVFHI